MQEIIIESSRNIPKRDVSRESIPGSRIKIDIIERHRNDKNLVPNFKTRYRACDATGGGHKTSMANVPFEKQFDVELERLRNVAASSTDTCITAMVITLTDKKTRELFLSKLKEGLMYSGVNCLGGVSIPENVRIVYLFDPPPGVFYFIRPSFLVIVNMIEKRVVQIVDPYVPDSQIARGFQTSAMPFTLAVPSAAPNVVVTDEQMASHHSREREFFGALGELQALTGHCPQGTSHRSPYASSSVSGGVKDDSQVDYTTDFVVDQVPD
jgi:hypothetical protein